MSILEKYWKDCIIQTGKTRIFRNATCVNVRSSLTVKYLYKQSDKGSQVSDITREGHKHNKLFREIYVNRKNSRIRTRFLKIPRIILRQQKKVTESVTGVIMKVAIKDMSFALYVISQVGRSLRESNVIILAHFLTTNIWPDMLKTTISVFCTVCEIGHLTLKNQKVREIYTNSDVTKRRAARIVTMQVGCSDFKRQLVWNF